MTRVMCLMAAVALSLVGCNSDEGAEPASPDTAPPADAGADAQPDMGGPDPEAAVAALVAAVDVSRYGADLELVARGPRQSPDGENWQATQDRCAEVFLAAGMQVTRQPIAGDGVNVIGVLPGLTRPDEQILLGAHYDSEFACNGADDNASGVAGVLEAARVLGARRFERSLVFICFDAEEYSLLGSTEYALRARAAGHDIRGALVLEMIGYRDTRPGSQRLPEGISLAFPVVADAIAARENRADFLFYAADDDPEMFPHLEAAAAAVEMPIVGVRLDAVLRASDLTGTFRRSDHGPLWAAGYPGIMISDTAEFRNPNYHCGLGDDDIDTVDVDFAVDATRMVVGALARAAVPADGMPGEGRVVDPAPPLESTRACDPVARDCPDGQRCALVFADEGRVLACVPPTEMPLGIDELCERDADGNDRCDSGLFCTLTGRAVGDERRCRPLCDSAADCAEGEACPTLRAEASNCIAGCDPFADECPPETGCGFSDDSSRRFVRLFCRQKGQLEEGEDCTRDFCRPGLVCPSILSQSHALGCLAWCRLSAPECNAGRVCRRIAARGLPDDLGLCVPEDALVP